MHILKIGGNELDDPAFLAGFARAVAEEVEIVRSTTALREVELRRVLNVDQAAVLVLDETAGTVELNRDLLSRQFRVTVR